MLKNRSLQVKVIQDTPGTMELIDPSPWTPEAVTKLAQEQIIFVAIVGGAMYALKTLLDTTSQVVVNKSSSDRHGR